MKGLVASQEAYCRREPKEGARVSVSQPLRVKLRAAFVLVNNRAEGNEPLTVEGLVGKLRS